MRSHCSLDSETYNVGSGQALLERVAGIILRYNMFAPGQRAGVAVSGGADSVALLHLLRELAPRWNLRLEVLHLNHGLRGAESDGDAAFVGRLAAMFGLPLHLEKADVASRAEALGDNLEQCARATRHEFYRRFLASGDLQCVALGHTRDDQAETVLFRILRGAGNTGLCGILPVTREGLVRPLLGVTRAEIRQYLQERGLEWREDSSNKDLSLARNRLRHDLLPLLKREWNPDITSALAQLAELSADEELHWESEAERFAAEYFRLPAPAIVLPVRALRPLSRAATRRMLRCAVAHVKGDLRGVGFAHIEELAALAASEEGHGRIQIPGVDAMRSFEWLRLAPQAEPFCRGRNFSFEVTPPAEVSIPGTGRSVVLQLVDLPQSGGESPAPAAGGPYNESSGDLDGDRVAGAFTLRNWRPGDRYRPANSDEHRKIKMLFQEARIPLWERASWPVLAQGGRILWARRFGPAADVAASPTCRRRLRVSEIEESREE